MSELFQNNSSNPNTLVRGRRTFPNTDAYLVNFVRGSGGHFIGSLVHFLVVSTTKYSISAYGNAHSVIENFSRLNWHYRVLLDAVHTPDYLTIPVYEYVEPKNSSKPIIFVDHNRVDLTMFFSKFPRGKNIVISYTESDIPIIIGNVFYKNVCEESITRPQVWEEWKLQHPIFNEYDDPFLVPSSVVEKFIETSIDSGYCNDPFWTPYKDPVVVSESNMDATLVISFHDIINNPNTVLESLCRFLKRKHSDYIETYYHQYLNAQNDLIKTYMPWVLR